VEMMFPNVLHVKKLMSASSLLTLSSCSSMLLFWQGFRFAKECKIERPITADSCCNEQQ